MIDEDHFQTIKEVIQDKHTVGRPEKISYIDENLKNFFKGYQTALVKVEARDPKAALVLAERKVRATMECLNFLAGVVAGGGMSLFIPTSRPVHEITRLAVAGSGSMHVSRSWDRPAHPISISSLRSSEGLSLKAVSRVEALLTEGTNDVENLMLTGVRWAGRATAERNLEESFLQFAIALESVVLPVQDVELTYRLSQRVARLLGKDVDKRFRLQKRTKELYGIRSDIVHDGIYEVPEKDCNEIRAAAQMVLIELLTNAEVRDCRSRDDLDKWFTRQTLS